MFCLSLLMYKRQCVSATGGSLHNHYIIVGEYFQCIDSFFVSYLCRYLMHVKVQTMKSSKGWLAPVTMSESELKAES